MSYLLLFASTMKSIGGVLLAVAILLVMVTVHEFGHYLAGKALGFQINEFAVGFGPAIFKKRSKKTGELFALRVIPLGGYCAFEGEDEELAEEHKDAAFEEFAPPQEEDEEEIVKPTGARFNDQKPWKRIIVLVAGATMNYLLALVLLFIMFGAYGCIHSYINIYQGVSVSQPTMDEERIGYKDIVLSVDGKGIYMETDYVSALSGIKQGESIQIELLRRDENGAWRRKNFSIEAQANGDYINMTDSATTLAVLGLDGSQYALSGVTVKQGFWETVKSVFVYSVKIGGTVLRSLGELLTGKIPISSMGGPVTTIGVAAQAASNGVLPFLNIASFIGVNLAVFNLLPVPALDGSKVVFCLIEWIRKKPINRKVETIIHFIGILVLFGFAILVDILQFI